ncbi:DMT family transporter [Cognatishimia sp. 1_MG-2023]|uniref:DMT family transporter n=1 Tax=Cognatishimia sp. 1_MG-2023 TaxID=3062642 RepID=UPI0026E47961|nr:DMT family transporter [Cognatishimia sp. 1_MG-2023]MDO6726352.1 DMT family transporter [Cognatishimia sp. 1_MG-2023]
MDLWILLALAAAFFQTLRFMLQKQLSAVKLTASGATFARFVYSAPIAATIALTYFWQAGVPVPDMGQGFWPFAIAGGFSQITATVCTVLLFGRRNFAVGLTFTKIAVLFSVLFGWVLIGDAISPWSFMAICIGFAGVLVLSGPMEGVGVWWKRLISPSAALGLLGGALFGVSGVAYRGATLAIESSDPFERAIVTLAIVTSLQLASMTVWLYLRDRAEIGKVLGAWRTAGFVGLTSLAGSFCWFTAYTLQNAAYVNAVGQIELIFGIIATVLFFNETISKREYLGIVLIASSVLGLVIWS